MWPPPSTLRGPVDQFFTLSPMMPPWGPGPSQSGWSGSEQNFGEEAACCAARSEVPSFLVDQLQSPGMRLGDEHILTRIDGRLISLWHISESTHNMFYNIQGPARFGVL